MQPGFIEIQDQVIPVTQAFLPLLAMGAGALAKGIGGALSAKSQRDAANKNARIEAENLKNLEAYKNPFHKQKESYRQAMLQSLSNFIFGNAPEEGWGSFFDPSGGSRFAQDFQTGVAGIPDFNPQPMQQGGSFWGDLGRGMLGQAGSAAQGWGAGQMFSGGAERPQVVPQSSMDWMRTQGIGR